MLINNAGFLGGEENFGKSVQAGNLETGPALTPRDSVAGLQRLIVACKAGIQAVSSTGRSQTLPWQALRTLPFLPLPSTLAA